MAAAASAPRPKRSGASFSCILRASDVASHENRLAQPAHSHRGKEQSHYAFRRGAPRNDGTPKNADGASPVELDRDPPPYNLKYPSRFLGNSFPCFPRFFGNPPQPSVLTGPRSQDVPQHQTGTTKPGLHGAGRYSQDGGCFRDAVDRYLDQPSTERRFPAELM